MEKNKSWPAFHRIEIAVVALAALITGLLVIFPVTDYDTFLHLANGRAMVHEGRIINEEVFSYTRKGTAFHNHEWLSQIILFLIYKNFGASGLIAFKTLVVLGIFFLLFKSARFLGAGHIAASLLSVTAVLAGLQRYTERPQLFSLLFLSILGFLFYGVREERIKPRYLFVIPPVMIIWDFLHGAIYGVIFLGAFVVGETVKSLAPAVPGPSPSAARDAVWLRRLWALTAVAFAAMLLNPYGLSTYGFFLKFTHSRQLELAALIREYMPTPLSGFYFFWALLILSAVLFFLAFLSARKVDITHIIVFLVFGVMAVRFNRAVAAFSLVTVPPMAYCGSLILARVKGGLAERFLKWSSLVVIAALSGYILVIKFMILGSPFSFGLGVNDRIFPAGAVRFVKEAGLQGNMYNAGHLGGYLAYELYPERKVFMYNDHIIFGDFPSLLHNRDFLDNYRVSYVIAGNDPASELLFSGEQWVPVFWDSAAAVLVKGNRENSRVTEKYGLKYYTPWISKEALLSLESSPAVLPVLAAEIARCLSFSHDEPLAYHLAKLLMRPGNGISTDDGIAMAAAALRRNPRSSYLYAAKGLLFYRSGRLDAAEDAFRSALLLDQGLKDARLNLAYIAYDKGNLQQAEAGFRDVLGRNKRYAPAYFGLGLTHLKMERYELARDDFERFLGLTPSGPWADSARQNLESIRKLSAGK